MRRWLPCRRIREWSASGSCLALVSGVRHPSLPSATPDEVRRELAGSKAALETLLDEEILTFAYPYGRSTALIRQIAKEVGFVAAFGVECWRDNLLDFSRIDGAACPGNTLLWRLKVSGAYRKLRKNPALRLLNNVDKRTLGLVLG